MKLARPMILFAFATAWTVAWWVVRLGNGYQLISFLNARKGKRVNSRLISHVIWAARLLDLSSFCLENSLASLFLLRWAGADCALRVGVRLKGRCLLAHAWTEVDEVPILPRDRHDPYPPLEALN